MKYYCIGSGIPLIKLDYTPGFFSNLPFFGTPILGKLPITDKKMRDAYEKSEQLILCKTLEDAKALRRANIIFDATNRAPEYRKRMGDYPLGDFAIYEIETSTDLGQHFLNLAEVPLGKIDESWVSFHLHMIEQFDRSNMPSIEIYPVKKEAIQPTLIKQYYFPVEEETARPVNRL